MKRVFFHTSSDRLTISSLSSDESSFMKEKIVLHECLALFLTSARADIAVMMISMGRRLIVMRSDANRWKKRSKTQLELNVPE
ncbi:hypothetical protein NPIL_219411 [Nephila pilipes]|uniref:Uncharacterized protein n=1 Tax=Nephila pilipes TaxID=299642 RepID=A0A8X6N792_NEPPI|nr:hypothetical protein NPIL_219411 [Nephila pilipes]